MYFLQFVSLYILLLLSAEDNRSIYIEMKLEKNILKCLVRGRFPGVTVSFFPSQFFLQGKNGPAHSFPGEKLTGQFFPMGKDLTSQFFPTQSVFSPHVIFSEKA